MMKHKFAFAASLIAMTPAFAQAPDIDLAGYRAVYEISFESSDSNSGIIGAEGRYVFDVDNACEGYATNERFVVRLARAEDPIVQDYRLTAFEAADGAQYRFTRTIELNGLTGQKASGELVVDSDKSSAHVDYAEADDQTYEDAVLTPVAHIRELLATAKSGENRHAAMIFDGDVDSPIFYAVTRIMSANPDLDTEGDAQEALEDLARWKIDTVYYPPETGEEGEGATPKFLFEAVLFENGVLTDLKLDYVDFALKATLSDLEVRASDC